MTHLSKPTSVLLFFIFIHVSIFAQTVKSDKTALIEKIEAVLNRRGENKGWFNKSRMRIPVAGKASFKIRANNTVSTTTGRLRPLPAVPIPQGINATCFDTSLRLNYGKPGKWFAPAELTKTRDGNILIPGFEFDTSNYHFDAHLVKCTQQGDTIWSRLIKGGFGRFF